MICVFFSFSLKKIQNATAVKNGVREYRLIIKEKFTWAAVEKCNTAECNMKEIM